MGIYLGPDGVRNKKIHIIKRNSEKDFDHEIIERKGLGHPDTICDSIACELSREFSAFTVKNCDNMVLHHQFDKVMIIGGKTDVSWGRGRFIEPIKINVAGRATKSYLGKKIPVDKIIEKTIRKYFQRMFPEVNFKKDVIINDYVTDSAGPGTVRESKGAIKNMFNPVAKNAVRGYEKLVANDTSYCIAYAPYSLLEKAVLEIEKYLNSNKIKKKYPWLGSDIKIMAVRCKDKIDITMCVPQISKYVKSLDEYRRNMKISSRDIMNILLKYCKKDDVDLSINTKDDYDNKNVYLTVSGASLSGDIGVVGRGNRPNGLITANRPMSLEGASGKNPRYYSGFIYSILARNIADKLYSTFNTPCEVKIISQNGGNLLNPWRIFITIDSGEKDNIKNLVEKECSKTTEITHNFVNGKIKTY
jgi:S-adenosylmethionine synthetase